jgi:hypothetical protein
MAMASGASVTVSIAAASSGILSVMREVRRVWKPASRERRKVGRSKRTSSE